MPQKPAKFHFQPVENKNVSELVFFFNRFYFFEKFFTENECFSVVWRWFDAWTTRILSLKPFSSTQILIFDNFLVPGFEKKIVCWAKNRTKKGVLLWFSKSNQLFYGLKHVWTHFWPYFDMWKPAETEKLVKTPHFPEKKTYWKKKLMENTFFFPTDSKNNICKITWPLFYAQIAVQAFFLEKLLFFRFFWILSSIWLVPEENMVSFDCLWLKFWPIRCPVP